MINNCNYSFYNLNNEKSDREYLYCSLTSRLCTFSRFCDIEGKMINTDLYIKCKEKIKKESEVPMGRYKVEFYDKGYAYVNVTDIGQIRKFKADSLNNAKSVELVEFKGEYYIKGTEPKQEAVVETKEEIKVIEPKKREKKKTE